MSCKREHSIIFKNFTENHCNEILLLVASIENACDQQCVEIESHGETVTLFNGNFKWLVCLHEGNNKIKLKYCNYEKVINLNYTKIRDAVYDIQPLYVIPSGHNGCFQAPVNNSIDYALQKINLGMKLAQCVMSLKIAKFIENESGMSLNDCEVFHSALTVEHVRGVNQFELYDEIASELIKDFGINVIKRRKFVAFVSCTKFSGLNDDEEYTYENIKNRTQANPALGMGFLALLGSGTFYSWPSNVRNVQKCFQDKTIVDTKTLLDDSNYRKTYGGNFSTSLGSLLHELGHIFDLGHTRTGIMGNDIDYVHRFFICENFTEIMPERIVSKCQKSSVEINSSSRLTKIKKGGEYLEKYRQQKNNDMTFFEENCILTLTHHRWFTQDKSDVYVEFNERTLKSNDAFAMVELRDADSLLFKFYDLSKKNLQTFQFPQEISLEKMTIFAITKTGCTYKKILHHH